MSHYRSRYSAYRSMWVMVFFDLPTETAADRKRAAIFRKNLIKDGFEMFQFSIYIRHCASRENAETHCRRVRSAIPEKSKIGLMTITDKQFSAMEIICGKGREYYQPPLQLELF